MLNERSEFAKLKRCFISKWLSIELSLLLLVSMVAFAGFVSWQNSGDELTGEAWGRSSWYSPPPRPSCPVVKCPTSQTCTPQYEVDFAVSTLLPMSGTKPGFAEGDKVKYSFIEPVNDALEGTIEVLAINPAKKEVRLRINGKDSTLDYRNGISYATITHTEKSSKGFKKDVLVSVIDVLQQGANSNFVKLAVGLRSTLRQGMLMSFFNNNQRIASDIHLISIDPSMKYVTLSADGEILGSMNVPHLERRPTKVGNIITVLGIKQI